MPDWFSEIQLMRRMHWTERQLNDENSLGTILRLSHVENLSDELEKREIENIGNDRKNTAGGHGMARTSGRYPPPPDFGNP